MWFFAWAGKYLLYYTLASETEVKIYFKDEMIYITCLHILGLPDLKIQGEQLHKSIRNNS